MLCKGCRKANPEEKGTERRNCVDRQPERRYRRKANPEEKGTESQPGEQLLCLSPSVAKRIPRKRELKDLGRVYVRPSKVVAKRIPRKRELKADTPHLL